MTKLRTLTRPRIEDFGISERDLATTPRPWLVRYRPHNLIALLIGVMSVLYVVMLDAGSSVSGAAFFSVILVAAWAIVLVPVFICLLCASEEVERRFLCRRYPLFEACLGYREAFDEYRRRQRQQKQCRADPEWWAGLSSAAYRFEVERRLNRLGAALGRPKSRETAGYDFEADGPNGRVLIRCEPGDRPVKIGVGRELVSCLAETGAHRAVVVTAAGSSAALAGFVSRWPLEVVDPETLRCQALGSWEVASP